MSKFLEQLEKDNNHVFFNTSEFAIEVLWNGYPIIVTDETPPESEQFTHGIAEHNIIYRMPKTTLTVPQRHEQVNINGELWVVQSVKFEHNDLVIRLRRFDDSC